MKFTIESTEFKKRLAFVTAASAKQSLALCNDIMLEVADGHLTMTCTDINNIAKSFVSVDVAQNGTVLVPAAKLFALISSFGSGKVEVVSSEVNLTVQYGTGNYTLLGHLPDDTGVFALPEIPEDAVEIPLTDLMSVYDDIKGFAAPNTEARRQLQCIAVCGDGNELTLVATNGKAMAVCKATAKINAKFHNVVVPPSVFNLLPKSGINTAKIAFSDKNVFIMGDEAIVVGKVMSASYPDWTILVPKTTGKVLTMNSKELTNAVNLLTALADVDNGITAEVTETGWKLAINARDGAGEIVVPASALDKDIPNILFNERLFQLAINRAAETVTVEVTEQRKPFVVRKHERMVAVIMPMLRSVPSAK